MAAGDVLTVVVGVDPAAAFDGCFADVTFEGLAIGGAYAFGLGTNDNPLTGTPKLVLTVTCKGYTETVLGTRVRSVWGKKRARVPSTTFKVAGSYTSGTFVEGETVTQATSGATGIVVIGASVGPHLFIRTITGTPNSTNIWSGASATFTPTNAGVQHGTDTAPGPREFFNGTNTTVRICLSHYVYTKDKSGAGNSGTNVTYSILEGLYGASLAGSGTATNSSVAVYQKVLASWSWVPYIRVTGAFKLRCTAWHGEALVGQATAKPGIDRVVFTVTDGTTTITKNADTLTIDGSSGFTGTDEESIQEFIADFTADDVATLIQGADLTCRFVAYPLIGDTTEVFDTSTSTLLPANIYRNQTYLCDRTGAWGAGSYAVVDGATGADPVGVTVGDDAGKWVGTGDPTLGSGTPYLTIARAMRAVRNYNNANEGHDTVGGGIVYVKAGSYNWLGATISGAYGVAPKTWATVKPYPGVARASVIISGTSGNTDISDRVKLENVRITASVNSVFSGIDQLWFDACEWESTANSPLATGPTVVYVTHNKVIALAQGFKPASNAHNIAFALVRGNLLAGFATSISPTYTVIGNARLTKYAPTSALFQDRTTGMITPEPQPIIAFNRILGWNSASVLVGNFATVDANTTGFVFVCNLLESTRPNSGGLVNFFSNLLTTGRGSDNVLIWHNTLVGERCFMGYNDTTTAICFKRYWSVKGNYWDVTGVKTDNYIGGSGGHGNRTGNWPVVWGVGSSGNVSASVDEIAAPGFDFEHPGISSIEPAVAQDISYAMFTDPNQNNGSEQAGLGTYTTEEGSPLRGLGIELVLAYDLDENARTTSNNDAGAYAHPVVGGGAGNAFVLWM